jgi:hypothetical protein
MPYLGNSPASNFASVTKDTFSGDGSTTAFTLSKAATTNGVAVFVENVRQEPTTAYAVSGTTLTFTAAPVSASGNNIYVLHHNTPASTATHPSGQDLTAANATLTGDVTIGSGTAADRKIVFDGNAQDYHVGLDDSADKLIIGKGSALGTTSHIVTDADGNVTMPLQPMMFAIRGSSRQTAAASNAQEIIPFTEQLDVGNDFASNVFTCPVDGKYFVSFYGLVLNASADGYSSVNIRVNSTNTLTAYQGDTTSGGNEIACSGIVSVSANDTLSCFFDGGSTNSKLHEGRFGGFTVQLIA